MVLKRFWTSTLVGANPAVLLKYSRKNRKFDTGIYHEDIANAGDAVTSGFIPLPKHEYFHGKRN
jgi:hypothetical protein